MSEIDIYRENNSAYFKDVSNLYYISDSENKVYVTLKKFDTASMDEFKEKVNNFAGIEFTESQGDLYLASEINPGSPALRMSLDGSRGRSSIGYGAKRNGIEGVVVSGHAFKDNDGLYADVTNPFYIGTCTISNVGGPVDCAFVPVDAGTPSNKIYGSQNILSAQTSNPGAGTFVNFRGRHTSQGGNIVSTSASGTFIFEEDPSKTYNYSNLTSVNLPVAVQNGDSGGIVYSYVSSTNTRYNAGNIVGYGKTSGLSYYAKTTEIIRLFGITPY